MTKPFDALRDELALRPDYKEKTAAAEAQVEAEIDAWSDPWIDPVKLRATTTIVNIFEATPTADQSVEDLVEEWQETYSGDDTKLPLILEDLDTDTAVTISVVDVAPVPTITTGAIAHPTAAHTLAADKISHYLAGYMDRAAARRQTHRILSILGSANLMIVDKD